MIQSVINFKATDLEKDVIKNYLIGALKQGLGIIDVVTPRISDLTNSMSQSTKRSGDDQKPAGKKEEQKKSVVSPNDDNSMTQTGFNP